MGPEQPETVQNFVSVFGTVAKKLMRKWLATQTMNFTSQLEAGIRFFDLRISTKPRDPDNELYFAHGLFSATVSTPRGVWMVFDVMNISRCLWLLSDVCTFLRMWQHIYVGGQTESLIIQGPSEILSTPQLFVCPYVIKEIINIFFFFFLGQRRPRTDQQFPVSSCQRGRVPGLQPLLWCTEPAP